MNKTGLHKALKVCQPALGNELIHGLSYYHFRGNTVSAFNGSLLIRAFLDEPFPVQGSISGDLLFKLINELPEEIQLIPSETNLVIKAGRSKSTFPVENIDVSFLEDSPDERTAGHLPVELLFGAGLKRCISTVGGKGIPQVEVGVHVFIDTPAADGSNISQCRMYSNNGIAYSRFAFPLQNQMAITQVFLPASFCENLIAMYSVLGTEPESIIITTKGIRAKFTGAELRSSFYSNPVSWEIRSNVDEAMDKLNSVDIPEQMWESLKRCEIVSNKTIKFHFGQGENDKLLLEAVGAKHQELVEELDLLYPTSGVLDIDVRGLRKLVESCKEIGFGDNYLLLCGKEEYYNVILTQKEV